MTFDEAWKQITELSFPIQVPDEADDAEVWMSDLIDVFEELRQEYAPTVEMTKEQHDLFINSTDFEKGQTNMDLGFGEMSLMQYAQIVMHPETIKVVDD